MVMVMVMVMIDDGWGGKIHVYDANRTDGLGLGLQFGALSWVFSVVFSSFLSGPGSLLGPGSCVFSF